MEHIFSTEHSNNLLIIDDEVEITKSLQRQFRKTYNMYLANSAEEAFDILQNNKINVIISDQRMPEMTGVDFFSKIRHQFPDVVRLILTGYADVDAIVRAINEGNIFRYISKPWNPDELETIIKEAFEKYKLIAQNKQLVKELKESNDLLEEKVNNRTLELKAANIKLKQLNATKDKFFSLIAHDLKNPFVTILGFSEVLLKKINKLDNIKIEKYVKNIYQSSAKAFELLENLLLWAGSQKGSIDYEPSKNILTELIDTNIKLVENQAIKKNIQILVNAEENMEVVLDTNMINTVLRNLITNAIKYTNKNGKISINANDHSDYIKVDIRDNGIGISPSMLNKMFDPDVNITTKGTGNEKGSGLGLILCKEFVEKHGGKISVESKLNEGSTFSFTIPANLSIK